MQKQLIQWYQQNKRDFPWRKDQNPYHIWISEIMLQQTTTETVIPYYERFLEKFPTIEALASASLEEVYKMWEGLGYYRRAKHLHESAQIIVEKYQGKFPYEYNDILSLKGIGEYRNIPIQSIYYFEVFQRIITVHYDNNEQFEFYSSIGKLEITVLPKGFLRIHRSYIVSVSQIKTFNSTSLTLMNGKELPVGRKYLPNLKTAFQTPENVI